MFVALPNSSTILSYLNGGNSGEKVDLYHWAGVMSIFLYKSDILDGHKALIPEYHINNLGGWAGDLQTLICNMKEEDEYISGYEGFYSILKKNIGNVEYSFSMDDLLADTDAYNIYNNINIVKNKKAPIKEAVLDYYDTGYKKRYTSFTNGWGKDKINNLVYIYTKDKYLNLVRWPLYKKYLGEEKVTSIESKEARDAFTDYIWNLVEMER